MKIIKTIIQFVEINYCVIASIYLYGWLKGLLVASALTSLLHIVILLQKSEELK